MHWAAADGPCHHRARRLTPPAEATWRRPSRASGPSHDASAGAPVAAALVAAAAGVAGSGHTSAACEEAALCGAPCAAPTAADGQGRRGRSVAASTALRALRRRDQPPRPPHLGTACARRSRAQGSGPAATGARWPLRAGRWHLRHGPGARGGPLEEVDRDRVGRRRRRACVARLLIGGPAAPRRGRALVRRGAAPRWRARAAADASRAACSRGRGEERGQAWGRRGGGGAARARRDRP